MSTLIGIIIAFFIFSSLSKKKDRRKDMLSQKKGEAFVSQLDSLGFYNYADSSNVDSLKTEMINHFDPDGELITIYSDTNGLPLDYRNFLCDGESLFEEGGFIYMLNELQPTFKKISLSIHIESSFEEYDEEKNCLNHWIKINGTKYWIFQCFKGYGWGEAAMQLAKVINIEAKKQFVKERAYLASGGKDGRLVFLTDDQDQLIYKTLKNPSWKPLKMEEWVKVMDVQELSLN